MDTEKIQQLKDEIKQEMSEIFKNSNFGNLLEKYGIAGENVLKFECMLDITKIQFSDVVENEQVKDSSRAIPEQQLVKVPCDWCPCCGCCD